MRFVYGYVFILKNEEIKGVINSAHPLAFEGVMSIVQEFNKGFDIEVASFSFLQEKIFLS